MPDNKRNLGLAPKRWKIFISIALFIYAAQNLFPCQDFANTAVGANSLNFNTSGSYNTATGNSALYSNIVGNNNSAFEDVSLYSNTTGRVNS